MNFGFSLLLIVTWIARPSSSQSTGDVSTDVVGTTASALPEVLAGTAQGTTGPVGCAPNHYQCYNRKCIPKAWVCDRQNDCDSGEDEYNQTCAAMTCGQDQFRCSSGNCISVMWRCDGSVDCAHGEDESNCQPGWRTCYSYEFTCNNRACINSKWRCDNSTDCHDGSDEQNCLGYHTSASTKVSGHHVTTVAGQTAVSGRTAVGGRTEVGRRTQHSFTVTPAPETITPSPAGHTPGPGGVEDESKRVVETDSNTFDTVRLVIVIVFGCFVGLSTLICLAALAFDGLCAAPAATVPASASVTVPTSRATATAATGASGAG